MRVRYVGLDKRTRVAEANRIKFISDSYKDTDNMNEQFGNVNGPAIVVHVNRLKGGKRVLMEIPEGFDIEGAKQHALEKGWIDLSACTTKAEYAY